jgi:oligosaccharide repeat unit polymerase
MENYDLIENNIERFRADCFRSCSPSYYIWLALALLVSFAVYNFFDYHSTRSILLPQILFWIIAAVHFFGRLKVSKDNILSPDILFVFFYAMIHLGYISLYSFGLLPYTKLVFYFESAIPKALLIINIGLIGFIFGYEMLRAKSFHFKPIRKLTVPGELWGSIGVFLLMSGILMHIVGLILLGPGLIRNYGYAAIAGAYRYTDSYLTILFLSVSIPLIVLGLVIYIIYSSLRYRKLFRSKFALALVVLAFAFMIMEGDRGPILKLIIPMLLVYHYFIKPVKIKYIVTIFLILVIIFSGLSVVRTIVFDPSRMLDEYKFQESSGNIRWYSAFAELGGAFVVVNITAHEVPVNEPYWKGATWRDSMFHMVPFLQGFTLKKGWSTWAPSHWVTTTYFGPNASGRGYTVAAEGYLNFGYVGVFVELMFLGLFIRWLTIKFCKSPSQMWALIMIGCLGPTILVIRNHLNLLTDVCVQVFVFAIILNMLCGNEEITESDNELLTIVEG